METTLAWPDELSPPPQNTRPAHPLLTATSPPIGQRYSYSLTVDHVETNLCMMTSPTDMESIVPQVEAAPQAVASAGCCHGPPSILSDRAQLVENGDLRIIYITPRPGAKLLWSSGYHCKIGNAPNTDAVRRNIDFCVQTVQLQWNAQVHHPIAVRDYINVGLRRDFVSPYPLWRPVPTSRPVSQARVARVTCRSLQFARRHQLGESHCHCWLCRSQPWGSLIPPGVGITLNSLCINPHQFGFQFPLWQEVGRGLPVEGFCVAAGVPEEEHEIGRRPVTEISAPGSSIRTPERVSQVHRRMEETVQMRLALPPQRELSPHPRG